jgi:hypothetical protein
MRPQAESLQEYLFNCLVVASEEIVEDRHMGIICSIVSSYKRSLEKELERKREATVRELSTHFGSEGQKGRWPATYLGSREFDGESYGGRGAPTVRYLHRFAINDRDIAVWWTGSPLDLEASEKVIIRGTIKSCDEYKGTAQTTLTRCDVVGEADTGKCPNCGGTVIPFDMGKNCPHCKKRGLKVADSWWAAQSPPESASIEVGEMDNPIQF